MTNPERNQAPAVKYRVGSLGELCLVADIRDVEHLHELRTLTGVEWYDAAGNWTEPPAILPDGSGLASAKAAAAPAAEAKVLAPDSGGSTAPAETAPSSESESMENQCWGSVVTGCHPGVPREAMTWPDEVAYLAELDALPHADVPDEPRGLCWDCRRLYRDGPGPQAAALRSEYARRTSAPGPEPRHPVDCDALDMGRR